MIRGVYHLYGKTVVPVGNKMEWSFPLGIFLVENECSGIPSSRTWKGNKSNGNYLWFELSGFLRNWGFEKSDSTVHCTFRGIIPLFPFLLEWSKYHCCFLRKHAVCCPCFSLPRPSRHSVKYQMVQLIPAPFPSVRKVQSVPFVGKLHFHCVIATHCMVHVSLTFRDYMVIIATVISQPSPTCSAREPTSSSTGKCPFSYFERSLS